MTRKTTAWLIISLLACSLSAQKKNIKWAEKAKKALLTIETTDKQGNTRQGNGFFINEHGEAVTDYELFREAAHASVTDHEGRKMAVSRILGADELYDIIKIKVDVPKKVAFLPLTLKHPIAGEAIYLLTPDKEVAPTKGSVLEISKLKGDYNYYKMDIPLSAKQISLPLLTADGKLFALAQQDASGKNNSFGLAASYASQLHIEPMELLRDAYLSIAIPKAWPADIKDAQISLVLLSSKQDAQTFLTTLNDFVASFPHNADAYHKRAAHLAYHRSELTPSAEEQQKLLDLAWDDLEKMVNYGEKKDEELFNQAKLIYRIALSDSTLNSDQWNIDMAEKRLKQAMQIEETPFYHQLAGDILFSKADYPAAYEAYMIVNSSELASAASFYMAAKSLQQEQSHNVLQVIALMDSAITRSATAPTNAIAYLLEVVELKMLMGQYQEAVKDYNNYYHLVAGNVTDAFYYHREQALFRSGDFDGALADIQQALRLIPDDATYLAEEGAIYLRMKDETKAEASIKKALLQDPEFASCYRLLGICQQRQQRNEEACLNFRKAVTLGDKIAEKLITTHCKMDDKK